MTEDKKQYTISYLARVETDKESVLKSLKEANASIFAEGRISELKLAYPIKKQTSAFFGSIVFETAPETISKIDEKLKFEEGILRFLIVVAPTRKSKTWSVNNQKNKEDIEKTDVINNTGFIKEEEASILEEAEKLIAKQIDDSPLTQSSTDDVSFIEELSIPEDKINDIAFDEKLEEILANSKLK